MLHSERFGAWLYDIAATMEKARRDGWGIGAEARATLAAKLGREPTARETAAAAVESDFNYCRGWLEGRYSWVSIRAAVFDREGDEIGDAWLGGVEWDSHGENEYATEESAGDVVLMALDECGLSLRQRAEAWRAELALSGDTGHGRAAA